MNDKSKDQQKPRDLSPGELPITVHAQYIRDLSFENPGAPDSFRHATKPPEMNINIGMDARKIPDEKNNSLFEVVLNVRAEAMQGTTPVFLAEILYGITLSVDERIPEDRHHPLLMIEIPRLSFPYVRQILSDLTMQGGYPPLILNPVDFHALYMQQFGEEIKKSQAQPASQEQKKD